MSDLTTRALDRAARAEDSPWARARVLVDRLRSAPLCETCGGSGRTGHPARESWSGRPQPDDVARETVLCPKCAGTGSPLRARVELAAYCGDEGAQAALGPRPHRPDCVGPIDSGWFPHRVLSGRLRGLQRWAGVGPVLVRVALAAARAGHEPWAKGLQRFEVAEAGHEALRRAEWWLRLSGGEANTGGALEAVQAAHDGAGPLAAVDHGIRSALSVVLTSTTNSRRHGLPVQVWAGSDFDAAVSFGVRYAGEAPVREAIQRSLIAWALSPGEP